MCWELAESGGLRSVEEEVESDVILILCDRQVSVPVLALREEQSRLERVPIWQKRNGETRLVLASRVGPTRTLTFWKGEEEQRRKVRRRTAGLLALRHTVHHSQRANHSDRRTMDYDYIPTDSRHVV